MQKRENYVQELSRIRGEINRLFESALMSSGLPGGSLAPGAWLPAMDVLQEDDYYQFFLELPGVDEASVRCQVTDNTVEITGERRMPLEAGTTFRRMERIYGPFRRTVELEGPISGQPQIGFDDGVMSVRVERLTKTD